VNVNVEGVIETQIGTFINFFFDKTTNLCRAESDTPMFEGFSALKTLGRQASQERKDMK
jgi:hypothetical protein